MPYFDHNATTPLLPIAREAWLRAADEAWQNPSSPYRAAARVHRLLEDARARTAEILGVGPREIVFTSGATEANNAVIAWAARTLSAGAPVLVSATEHPSVLEPGHAYFAARLRSPAVTSARQLNPDEVAAALSGTAGGFVALMAANNETGALPTSLPEVAETCRQRGAWLLCDATQWIGRLPARELPRHAFLVGSAHKFGGPKGVGLLRVPAAARDAGFAGQRGGEQEHGRRAGTENFPNIAAMLAALEWTETQTPGERAAWAGEFGQRIATSIPGTRVNARGLWNTVSLCLPAHENTRWVARLDKLGFEVSTGSACASGSAAPSHVLAAIGLTPDEARRTIRVSSGWATTREQWSQLAVALEEVWRQLQAERDGGDVIVPT